jgi:hypothetical protein
MTRIKSSAADPRCSEMRHALSVDGDKNFCTVVALAAICRIPVAEAKAAMAAQGRKDGQGASDLAMIKAAKALGFEMKQVPFAEYWDIIKSYPGAHKNLKTITTHHPVRFAKAWAGRPDYLMFGNYILGSRNVIG